MPATPLITEVLAALRRIGCPVTTADLLRHLNRGRATPLISDQVYRAADALRARGSVRSLRTTAHKRIRYWEYVAESPACTCRTQDTS
jgi:Fe2+ or Zn2+ uptake regulation protein